MKNSINNRKKNLKNLPSRHQGFTLIEIIVVLVIIGVLATLVAPNVLGFGSKARIQKAESDIKNIGTALDLYRLDNSRYPTTEQGLEALVSKPSSDPVPRNYKTDGYLNELPEDPWGEVYSYVSPGEHGKYDLYTLGADATEGGEEEDADIGNWTK